MHAIIATESGKMQWAGKYGQFIKTKIMFLMIEFGKNMEIEGENINKNSGHNYHN